MRQESAALAFEVEEKTPRQEFGTGLRARLELVQTLVDVPPPASREISPELMLVSPPGTDSVLAEIFARHVRQTRSEPLGTLLSEAGLLDPAELEVALTKAAFEGRRLGEILIDFGLVTSADIVRAVAKQRGLPFVDVQALPVDPSAARLLPIDHARALRTLPIGFVRGLPVVALADPSDEDAMDGTRAILRAAEFVASPEESVLAQLSRVYLR
jgi:CBS domain-containing protein